MGPRPAGTARALLALAVLAAATGCSYPTDSQPRPGACEPLRPVTWTPLPNAQEVPRDTDIRIAFSDYPDPDTVGAANMLLWSGVFWHTGTYAVDLIDKAAVFRPANPLGADLGYTLTVAPAMSSLSGCPTTQQTITFRTAQTLGTIPPRPAPAFSDVRPILARSCAGAGCHRQPAEEGGGCLLEPAKGLSLCDADARAALVGVPSREVSRLRLVEPRNSAQSYLLRKLLPGATPDVPVPTTLGQREPPGAPLSTDEIRLIADWIDDGAGP